MTRLALVLAALALLAGGAAASTHQPSPAQLRAKIRAQAQRINDLKDTLASLRDERAAQDVVIADQSTLIAKLRARDPLEAVTARDPNGLWDAMQAIYAAFPKLPAGVFCGYDKTSAPLGSVGLVATTYTFYLWSGC